MNDQRLQQPLNDLIDEYRRKFLEVHAYNMVFLPTPLTKEWLIDQLHALEWYKHYETSIELKPQKEIVKRKVVRNTNPFK
jgi:hypothetical protein